MTRLQDPSKTAVRSSLFFCGSYVDEISTQQIRKIAKNEPVYLAVIRLVDNETDHQVVQIDEDKTTTPYPVQVQAILEEFSDVFPKTCRQGYHHNVTWTT